jgi:hypothetical protein
MKLNLFKILVILILPVVFSTCKISYSFTGSQIDAKTISINYFPNKASIIQPSLSQTLTEAFRDKFVNQTKLELVKRNADLHLEGEITGYSVSPVAIQGDETAAMNRLKITVNVRFTNTLDEDQSFEQSFSAFQDYDSSVNLSAVEGTLIEAIVKQIVEDVFNKALVNW